MRRIRLLQRQRAGTTLVETAFVLPVVLLVLFGVFEYGRLLWVRSLIDNAAREAARYAVVHTNDLTTTDIQNKATQYLGGQGGQLSGLLIEVYKADPATGTSIGVWTDAAFGEWIGVKISGAYTPVTPSMLFLPSSIPLSALSMMSSEAN